MISVAFFKLQFSKGLIVTGISLLWIGVSYCDTVEVFSKTHRIDRVIKSMEGEPDDESFRLFKAEKPELLWVTTGNVQVIDANTQISKPAEMLCHSHLMFPFANFDQRKHNALFGNTTNLDLKLFTLVQGQTDIELPKGFAIPVLSNETFSFSSMIISPQKPQDPMEVKAKGTFEFYRDKDLPVAPKPLFWRGLALMVPVKSSMTGDHCTSEMTGVSAEGTYMPAPTELSAEPAKASMNLVHEHQSGKYKESYHWMVPPGRHEYRYTLENGLMIPFDTTMHYANLHLHPYAESLELRDLTTGQSIYKGYSKNLDHVAGIAQLTYYSDEKGIQMHKDHLYELVCVYNNTTDREVDAMAIMFVYFLDKNFDRDQLKLSLPASPKGAGQKTAT